MTLQTGVQVSTSDGDETVRLEGSAAIVARHHGEMRISITRIAQDRWRIKLRNLDTPTVHWAVPIPTNGGAIEIHQAMGYVPDTHEIFLSALHEPFDMGPSVGITDPDFRLWSLLNPSDEKVPLKNFDPSKHWLRGGEAISWDVVPKGWTPRLDLRDPALEMRILDFLEQDPSGVSPTQYPTLSKLHRMWSGSFSRYRPLPPDNDRDFAWWLLSAWRRRWNQGHSPNDPNHPWRPDNWMTLGASFWGEGFTSNHYDLLMQCVMAHLVYGDPTSLHIAYQQAVWVMTRGLIRTSSQVIGAARMDGMTWWEKGLHRPGDANIGSTEEDHRWIAGCLAVSELFDDPDMGTEVRGMRDRLVNYPTKWNRYYGIRENAWHARDCLAFYIIKFDTAAAMAGLKEIERVIALLTADEMLWPNDGDGDPDGWQDGRMNYWAGRLLMRMHADSVFNSHKDRIAAALLRITQMTEYCLDNCLEEHDRQDGTMFVKAITNGFPGDPAAIWDAHPTKLAYWYPMVAQAARVGSQTAQLLQPIMASNIADHFMQNSGGVIAGVPQNLVDVNWTNPSIGTANTKILGGVSDATGSRLMP